MRKLNVLTALALASTAQVLLTPDEALASSPKSEPAKVEKVTGTDLNKITLEQHAAERLGIETAVVAWTMIERKRTVAAEVVADDDAHGAKPAMQAAEICLRVLPIWNAAEVSTDQSAKVFPASSRDTFATQSAEPYKPQGVTKGALYYLIKNGPEVLKPPHRVLMELSNKGLRVAPIPLSAMFYDAKGGTWVYESPAPLIYVRRAIRVAYVDDQIAYLADGPADKTAIVTVGAQLLQGVEFKVGH
jgi:hypothetical protein